VLVKGDTLSSKKVKIQVKKEGKKVYKDRDYYLSLIRNCKKRESNENEIDLVNFGL